MLGKTNVSLILGILKVSCPNSATVTVTNGNLSLSNTGTYSEFKLPKTGNWTIQATYNGLTETYTRTVNAGQTVSLTVLNNIHIYHNQNYLNGFTGTFNGWYNSNVYGLEVPYNPIDGDHVYAEARLHINSAWARSSAAVNLTGIKTVKFLVWGRTVAGFGDGNFAVHVTDASGNLLAESGYQGGGDRTYENLYLSLNVSSINRTGHFQIYAERWGDGAESRIHLHDIWLLA